MFSSIEARARSLARSRNERYAVPRSDIPSGQQPIGAGGPTHLERGLRQFRNHLIHQRASQRDAERDANAYQIPGSSRVEGPLLTSQELTGRNRYVRALRDEARFGRSTFLTGNRGIGNQPGLNRRPVQLAGSLAEDFSEQFFKERNRVNDISYGFDNHIRNVDTGEYELQEFRNQFNNPFVDDVQTSRPELSRKDPQLKEQSKTIGDYSALHAIQEHNGHVDDIGIGLADPVLSESNFDGLLQLLDRKDPNIDKSRFSLFKDPLHSNSLVELNENHHSKSSYAPGSEQQRERQLRETMLSVKTPLESQRKRLGHAENLTLVHSDVYTPQQLRQLRAKSRAPIHRGRALFHPARQVTRQG